MAATISADIIASTTLSPESLSKVQSHMKELITELENACPGVWGRVVKGDMIECYIPQASDSIRIALMIKTRMRSIDVACDKNSSFNKYRIRVAIGIGDMRTHDKDADILDGQAIYLSGRKIDQKTDFARGTLFVETQNDKHVGLLAAIALLLDAVINDATRMQCLMLYYKLFGFGEEKIAKITGKGKSSVYNHLRNAHWTAIERAITAFESLINNIAKS